MTTVSTPIGLQSFIAICILLGEPRRRPFCLTLSAEAIEATLVQKRSKIYKTDNFKFRDHLYFLIYLTIFYLNKSIILIQIIKFDRF